LSSVVAAAARRVATAARAKVAAIAVRRVIGRDTADIFHSFGPVFMWRGF
jgi:hypothetical protein